MSIVYLGERRYGRVDHVPGLFYTSTTFWHINYIPVFPLRSYVVLEGSEDGREFRGTQIPLRFKSVAAGYLRAWLGLVACFAAGVAGLAMTGFYLGEPNVVVAFGTAGALVGILWFMFNTRSRWFLLVQLLFLLISAFVYYDVCTKEPNAAPVPGARPGSPERRRHDASYVNTILIANGAAFLYSLTRLLTPASYQRALESGEQVGLTREDIDAHLDEDLSPEWLE